MKLFKVYEVLFKIIQEIMNYLKAPKVPFKTVEEAKNYIQENGEDKFLFLAEKYQQSLGGRHTILSFLLFPVYFALVSLILLFDYEKSIKLLRKFSSFFIFRLIIQMAGI